MSWRAYSLSLSILSLPFPFFQVREEWVLLPKVTSLIVKLKYILEKHWQQRAINKNRIAKSSEVLSLPSPPLSILLFLPLLEINLSLYLFFIPERMLRENIDIYE